MGENEVANSINSAFEAVLVEKLGCRLHSISSVLCHGNEKFE